MKKIVKISTNKPMEIIELDNQDGSMLKVLQDAVGGYVQVVDLKENLSLWCNEEGKMLGLPANHFATILWEKRFGKTDVIVGNAVFTGGTDSEGQTLGLTDEQIAWFKVVTA
jgi:hypothetical protein